MEYHSATHKKKKEILPLATTWRELESMMRRETSRRKADTVRFHLYAESEKQNKTRRQGAERRSPEGEGGWGPGDAGEGR